MSNTRNNNHKGYIYLFTNEEHSVTKIGYADDVEQRLKQINSGTGVIETLQIFAKYAVEVRLTDIDLHKIIDIIDPKLRITHEVNGKEKKKEFFKISPEKVYIVLEKMAKIHNCSNRLEKIGSSTCNKNNKKKSLDSVKLNGTEVLNPRKHSTRVKFAEVEKQYNEIDKIRDLQLYDKGVSTRYILSEQTGYSETSMKKCIKIIKEASEEDKKALRDGTKSVNEVYDWLNKGAKLRVVKGRQENI